MVHPLSLFSHSSYNYVGNESDYSNDYQSIVTLANAEDIHASYTTYRPNAGSQRYEFHPPPPKDHLMKQCSQLSCSINGITAQ